MDKISIFFTIYLLRPRHKRDRHHLYHRWQINQKVTELPDPARPVKQSLRKTTRQIYSFSASIEHF